MRVDVPFSKQVIYSFDLRQESLKAGDTYGRTDRYSTGMADLDTYLWGGYGRTDNWEMVILHGAYKTGKSTVGLNLLRGPLESGVKVGIFALEDDLETMNYRLALAMDDPTIQGDWQRQVRWLPRRHRKQPRYKLSELLDQIENWFTDTVWGVDIILLDHLQFAFESAAPDNDRSQWSAQSSFVQDLNALLTEVRKTVILVSQENREGNIAGSIGLPRAATKLIGIKRLEEEPDIVVFKLEPSRGIAPRPFSVRLQQRDERLYVDTDQCSDFNREIRGKA